MLSSPPPPHTYHPGGLPENDPPSPDRPPSRQTFHLVPSKPTDSPQPAPDITELDLTKKAFIFPLGTRYSERPSGTKTFSTTIPKTADFYTPMKSDSYATIPKHYGGAIVLLLQGAVTRISRDPIMSVPAGSRIIDMKEQKAIEEWCKMIYDKKVLENRARIRFERRLTHSCRCFKINLWRAKGEKFILVEVEPDQSR
ncbi:hypothetical protein APHAL10511_005483 [Amanita phalloides]|nr:hypothetical protein APHAL10511_005483 [Amanita phalloides]